ncbi:hypothetical protein DPX16_14846 [Anabarilius grahami]|uniref:Uncharacterized protein n=1 Tax=Anabarilius grahami TaxID=495550 RepID=A0A3N0YVH2_ANAGA|nr:hypothetical protein DPX16_14846 [Anabarilius grahami]
MDAHLLRSPSGGGIGFTEGSRSRLSVHTDLRTQEISQPSADQTSSYPAADLLIPRFQVLRQNAGSLLSGSCVSITRMCRAAHVLQRWPIPSLRSDVEPGSAGCKQRSK